MTIGLFARGVRTGRGYWLAAIALSLTLAAHILPWFWTIEAVIVVVIFELLQRRGIGDPNDEHITGDYARPLRFAIVAGLISVGLSAWWLTSFVTTQKYTNSMGYTNDPVNTLHSIFTTLGWFTSGGGAAGDRWVIVLAIIALIVAFWVRDRLGMILTTLTVLSIGAFVFDPQNVIWNERLVPFWFITIHLSAGWLFGYVLMRWAKRRSERTRSLLGADRREPLQLRARTGRRGRTGRRPAAGRRESSRCERGHLRRVVVSRGRRGRRRRIARDAPRTARDGHHPHPGTAHDGARTHSPVASALSLNTTGNQVSSWAQWNYSGYQAKASWPEYNDLMQTMAKVGAEVRLRARHVGVQRRTRTASGRPRR